MTEITVGAQPTAGPGGEPGGAGRSVVVTVVGELDLATAPRLRELLIEAVTEQRPQEVWVDLAGVTFLDSTGIGALVAGRKQATRAGVRFAVRNPRGIVHKVLDVAGLLDILGIAPTSPPE